MAPPEAALGSRAALPMAIIPRRRRRSGGRGLALAEGCRAQKPRWERQTIPHSFELPFLARIGSDEILSAVIQRRLRQIPLCRRLPIREIGCGALLPQPL